MKKPIFVNKPISNFDIMNWIKYLNVPNFRGVFSRDEIIKFATHGCYIVNLEESWQTGSHWVAIHIEDNIVKCFDSFGLPPTNEIIKLSNKLRKRYVYNSNQYQLLTSVTCGYFCIYFVNESCNKRKTFYDIIKPFSIKDMVKNEKFIKTYITKL